MALFQTFSNLYSEDLSIIAKNAGFVHESFRNESFEIFGLTNRIHDTNLSKTGLRNESTIRIFQKQVYKTNPRYESLRFGFANPDSRVCQPGFVRIRFVP